ncbi:MAG: AbrB/MazE/SpoVT family DNA-binding domain-containing protein [Gammaproteobacteria bacterium]|nr:AbrB/MazE/SpoVT family DNA-binding domain-containing protein [Gammaproteobacteria bacterium]
MATATITSKGQVTIPKSVRDTMHIHSGDRIEFIKINNERYEIVAATKDIQQLKGMVKTDKTVSINEMNTTISSMGQS